MAFKKLARQCLPTYNKDVDLDDLTVPERLTRIKDKVKHMLKTGDTSMYIQTHSELESLRACVLDDIITTPAEDLLLYTNCFKSKVSNLSVTESSSSFDLDTLVVGDLTKTKFGQRRAFSIPDLHWSYSVKENKKKPKKMIKRFWNAIKKMFGKKKDKKYGGFRTVTEKIESFCKPNIYDEIVDDQILDLNLAYDINNNSEQLVYDMETVEVSENDNIMSSGDARICHSEGAKMEEHDEGNVPCQNDFTDLTESEAYDIAYGVHQAGIAQ